VGGVGATLREARTDRGVELSEVEAATKIRRRFLKAIENEAWDVLPGPAYAAGFVRAYADYLGLDGARMAAECPLRPSPPMPDGEARRGPRPRVPPAVAVSIGLVAVIGLVGLLWGGGGDDGGTVSSRSGDAVGGGAPVSTQGPGAPGSGVPSAHRVSEKNGGAMELSLTTTAELWVCLLDEEGEPLVDGLVLPSGAEEGPFRSGSFTVSFGNGEVEMRIDGRDSEIPESASPLGYEVGPGGDLSPLSESARPTCT
jgi:cytoskeleton protein RodZ